MEKQKADLMLQQAYFQQQAAGAGPSLLPQLPQQQQQQHHQSHMQPGYGVAAGCTLIFRIARSHNRQILDLLLATESRQISCLIAHVDYDASMNATAAPATALCVELCISQVHFVRTACLIISDCCCHHVSVLNSYLCFMSNQSDTDLVSTGLPVGPFNGSQPAVMQYMGVSAQNNMSLPPQQQAAMAQGMAAGMMQQGMQPQSMQGMQPHSMQSMQHQGMLPQGLHGDMMMQQHTHVPDPMGGALGIDAFSSHDLLDDAFPCFSSPVVDTQSSSSQHQGDSGVGQGLSVKSETYNNSSSSGSLTKNPSLQRNLRKLSVKGRPKSTGQGSTPDDMFTTAMQNAQMQMSMAMPVVGPGSWLSPSTLDTSQDGVRRPPAA